VIHDVISPTQVSRIQQNLQESLDTPVELIVQSNVARTVGALDSLNQVNAMNLDGDFINKDLHPRVVKSKQADTIIRNFIAQRPGITLLQTQLLEKDDKEFLLATITGLIYPSAEATREVESVLREKLHAPDLELIVRFSKYELLNRDGRHRAELTGFVKLSADQQEEIALISDSLKTWFADESEYKLINMDYTLIEEEYYFYLDVAGPHFFPLEEVKELQSLAATDSRYPVKVFVISSDDTVASDTAYESYIDFSHRILEKLAPALKADLNQLIEQSNL
jgi:F0F1-type ATP synthase delta subunit